MSPVPELRGTVHQKLFLPRGACEVQALLAVDAVAGTGPAPEAAEVIILDESESMGSGTLQDAVEAAGTAIDLIRDDVWFAVIGGSDRARALFPTDGTTVRADEHTRAGAKVALRAATAAGGTRMGEWLRLAARMLERHTGAVRHVVLLTDGRNEHESDADLADAAAACEAVFTCDCRGVGPNWSVAQVREIARALHGSVDAVAHPSGLAADLAAVMAGSMRKQVPDVDLRMWTPLGARVRLVKQTAPDPVDLTARRRDVHPRIGHYPTGSWGAEPRDFHVTVGVPAGDVGQERLACRLSFVRTPPGGDPVPLEQRFTRTRPDGRVEQHQEALVSVAWTDDVGRATATVQRLEVARRRSDVEALVDRTIAGVRRDDPDALAQLERLRELAAGLDMSGMVARIDDAWDDETGTWDVGRLKGQHGIDIEVESSRHEPQRDPDDPEAPR